MITEEEFRKMDNRAQRFAHDAGLLVESEEKRLATRAVYITLYGVQAYVMESAHFSDEVRRVIMEERDMDKLDFLLEEDEEE